MTDGLEKLTLDLSFAELMRAAALAGYVVGERHFGAHADECADDDHLSAYVSLMARIGLRKALTESYHRQFEDRPEDDDFARWLWRGGCHAFATSEHPGGPDHE